MNTDTFAAYDDSIIWGTGATAEAAMSDAAQWVDDDGGIELLRTCKANLLLSLSSTKRRLIAGIQDARIDIRVGEFLLLRKIRRSNTRAIAAKSAGCDRIAQLTGLLLLVILIE